MRLSINTLVILFGVCLFSSCASHISTGRLVYISDGSIERVGTSADLCVDFRQIIRSSSEWRKSYSESKEEAYWSALMASPETDVLVAPIYEIQSKRVFFLFPRYRAKVQGFHGNYCGQRTWSESIEQMQYISELDIRKLSWMMGEDYDGSQHYSDIRIERIIDVTSNNSQLNDNSLVQKLDTILKREEHHLELQESENSKNHSQSELLDDTISNLSIVMSEVLVIDSMRVREAKIKEIQAEFLKTDSVVVGVNKDSKPQIESSNDTERKETIESKNEEGKMATAAFSEQKSFEKRNDQSQINRTEKDESILLGLEQEVSEEFYVYHDFAVASLIKRLSMQEIATFVDFEELYFLENEFLTVYFTDNTTPEDYTLLDQQLAQLEKRNAQQLIFTMQSILVKLSSNDYIQNAVGNDKSLIQQLELRVNDYLKTLPSELKVNIQSEKDLQIFRKQLLTLYRAALCYRRIEQLSATPLSSNSTSNEGRNSDNNSTELMDKRELTDFPRQLDHSIFELNSDFKYSRRNPIPRNVALPDGVVFSVQVGAFRKELPNDFYRDFGPIRIENVDGQLNRYIAGCMVNEHEAQLALEQIRLRGFPDAFLVAYRNGKRIPVHEARALKN